MASILLGKEIDLKAILSGDVYAVKDIRARFSYKDGVRQDDVVEGYVYTVLNLFSLDVINVLVRQDKPLLSSEELKAKQEKGEYVKVMFDKPVLKQYRRDTGVEDSISAAGVKLVAGKQ